MYSYNITVYLVRHRYHKNIGQHMYSKEYIFSLKVWSTRGIGLG